MGLVSVFWEILSKPSIGDVLSELLIFIAPLWVAVIVGVLVGWAWKPKWANLGREIFMDSSASKESTASSSESASTGFGSLPNLNLMKLQLPSCFSWSSDYGAQMGSFPLSPTHSNCSRTVFDDATPEMVRDFFWDDEFRAKSKWDEMLLSAETLESSATDGTMVVHWVRKFPFFCSDREYLIGRRIWASGQTYYCVTKGVPYPSVPRKNKPRRVDLYFSSWRIRAIESRNGDGQHSACEVLLFTTKIWVYHGKLQSSGSS
ncbi:putative beta-1,3-galactosyltransferase 6 [Hibiscus syriacus]|uniref:Beta-1,3-galactosyltransferase 6 n=1 Tax=Hibiscus syriacus TaxID=106335 RepID=A0A6A3A2V2_HIBSY|nr:putative beta-1,3-galactosyltransferase 6 [Hibiscus syriacus]